MPDFKFSCPNCDQHISADESWSGREIDCPTCKTRIVVPGAPTEPSQPPELRIHTTKPQPPATAAGQARPRPGQARPQRRPTAGQGAWSGLAIASFVTALIGCLSPVAVICGHLALNKFKKDPSLKGKWMAVTGLVLGYLGILSGVVIAFTFGGAILHARKEFQNLSQSGEFVVSESAEDWQSFEETSDAPSPPASSDIPSSIVSGEIKGRAVTCGYALVHGTQLEFKNSESFGNDPWIVFFLSSPSQTLEGLSWEVPGDPAPSIHVHYKTDTGSGSFVLGKNYSMRLDFGQIQNKKLPGKVYLKADSPNSIELEGTFEAVVE